MHSKTRAGFENIINPEALTNEIHKKIKKNFPLRFTISHNQIIKISYDENWQENKVKMDHTKGQTNHKLTSAEMKIIDQWIVDQLE
jgi:hypothetical protein